MFARFVVAAIATAATAVGVAAQVPGAPVLQNAFANPGLALAANFGGGGGQSFYGAAAAWGLGGGKFLVSGAAGVGRSNGSARGAYGGRAAMSVWSTSGGSLGLAAFAGIGGAPSTKQDGIVNAGCTVAVERVLEMYPDGRMDILTVGKQRFEVTALSRDANRAAGVAGCGDSATACFLNHVGGALCPDGKPHEAEAVGA